MHKAESVLENKMHKTIRDFKIHTDHLIATRRPDIILINMKKITRGFCPSSRPLSEVKRKQKD